MGPKAAGLGSLGEVSGCVCVFWVIRATELGVIGLCVYILNFVLEGNIHRKATYTSLSLQVEFSRVNTPMEETEHSQQSEALSVQ